MRNRLDLRERLPYLASIYRVLDRRGKRRQLDELERMTDYACKYLISLLSVGGPARRGSGPVRRRRVHRYSEEAIGVLVRIWERSGRLSAERLKEQLPLLLRMRRSMWRGARRRWRRSYGGSAHVGFRAGWGGGRRSARRRQSNSATQRSRLLRTLIAVSTRRDSDEAPGLPENDTVSHGGGNVSGQFLRTLNSVDVATGWVCAAPVASLRPADVMPALQGIVRRMPFPVRRLHSDNGLEFINREMWEFCARNGLELTRRAAGRTTRTTTRASSRRTGPTCAGSSATTVLTARPRCVSCGASTVAWSAYRTCSSRAHA